MAAAAGRQILRRIIQCNQVAKPGGHYSYGVVVDNTMYVSGITGTTKEGQLVEGGVKAQTAQTLDNIKAVLSSAGCTLNNVVKTTVLLADIKDFSTVNSIYATYFPTDSPPSRTTYQVGALPKNALVEIDAIAVVGGEIITEKQ